MQEGAEAVLECAVANLAGQVQWAKDGFALGKFDFKFTLFFDSGYMKYVCCTLLHV